MSPWAQFLDWLAKPGTLSGPGSIGARVAEHLAYTGLALALSLAIAVPIGLYVGHTGRGRVAVVALAGMLRALPTLGMVTLFILLSGTLGIMPPIWALVLLAVPPLLAGTAAGIAAVPHAVVDGARAMGLTETQVLFRVEVPNALPVLMGALRLAVLQIIATVAVVAVINLGGLGRFLMDGLAVRDYGQVLGGALVIAVLAMVVDAVLAAIQRLAVSPGLATTTGGRA
ncbi:ABC transporter permease [Zafaria sp. Z1313]|uniref:ABC transporter permease n=1 Tax=unclassified Zafaria TaxID=2828765 RepID=UPI002E7733FE|nr:ABC transporter permease subunit [Zafaria sp. J156]MEE1620437.1 ABC transporter permease subunit [Zafaria sp. J156]